MGIWKHNSVVTLFEGLNGNGLVWRAIRFGLGTWLINSCKNVFFLLVSFLASVVSFARLGRPRQVPSKSLYSHHSLSSSCFILNCIILAAKTATLNYLTLWTLEDNVSGDKIEKNEMGGTCSACSGRGKAYTWFWPGNLRERAYLGDPAIDGRILTL